MNKKVFPNFWQASIIVLCYVIISLINYVGFGLIIKNSGHPYLFEIIRKYMSTLLFFFITLFLAKKSKINFLDYYSIPNFYTLMRLIVIVLLVRLVITMPFDRPSIFFNSFLNSKLRLIGISTTRQINVYFDISSILFSPIVQEIFFSGLILKQFLKQYSPIKAILLSSLLFSLYHVDIENFLFLFALGVLLGTLYYKSNSILITTIAHIIWNMINIFNWQYIDLVPSNYVIYISSYIISLMIVTYLLKMPLMTIESPIYFKKMRDRLNSLLDRNK